MYILLCPTWYIYVPLCDPPTTILIISGWTQFWKVTIIIVSCIFTLLSLPNQKRDFFVKLFKFFSKNPVDIHHMEDFCHQLVQVDLFCSWGHLQVIQCGVNLPVWEHILCTVKSCIFCTHFLSELEVVVLVWKIFKTINFCLTAGFSLHYLQE